MDSTTMDKILRQAEAVCELQRLDRIHATVPQSLTLKLSSASDLNDDSYTTLTRDVPNCPATETLADIAFRERLAEGLVEYRRLLEIMAETGEVTLELVAVKLEPKMPTQQIRILPYLPEIERLAAEVQRCSYEAGQAVREYHDGDRTTDPVKPACAIEELYAAAVSVLLTTRAALSACGLGTRPIP